MMSPIGLYLAEFSPQAPPPNLEAEAFTDLAAFDPEGGATEDDLSSKLEQARREGVEDGAASVQEALAAQAAALEQQHAEQLHAERLRWSETEGAMLAELLRSGLGGLEDRIADALVDILQPFMVRETRLKVVADLREAIASLIANGPGAAIRVSGPEDLVASFSDIAGVEILAAETAEVTLLVGDTTIRSQIQSWADVLTAHAAEA